MFWAGNLGEAGWYIHGYESVWLPAALFEPGAQARLADALFAASRPWHVTLHFNKGLAGAPREALAASRDTAMNPVVLEAAALAIAGGGGPPRVPGTGVNAPDVAKARDDAARIAETMQVLRRRTGARGTYVSESSYFEHDWRARNGVATTRACWPRSAATTPRASSPSTTAWAARTGARTGTCGCVRPDEGRIRSPGPLRDQLL